jgi:tetratricopeptide (TPR) repeat protein
LLIAVMVSPAGADQAPAAQVATARDPAAVGLPRNLLEGLPAHIRTELEAAFKAVAGNPRDTAAVGRLAMLLHAFEQYRAASDWYRLVQRLDPSLVDWTYLGGVVDAELGAHAAAIEAFQTVLQRQPDHLPARLRLAEALMRLGDPSGSREQYARLAREYPELALAHYGLGRLSTIKGDAAAALLHFGKAVALAPEYGPAHYALALAYRDTGRVERAEPHLEAYRRLGTRRPTVVDPTLERVRSLRETARDHLAEAARLADAGQLDAAIEKHLKALDLDPGAAQAHVNLISLYGRRGEREKARGHYEAALKLDGSVSDAHYNYGVLLVSEGRTTEAADAFRRALSVNPFHPAAHNNLASLLARNGRYEEAAAHYRQALANDPQHPTARVNLGRVLARLGRREEALAMLRHALERAEQRGDAKLSAAIRAELQTVMQKQ